MTGTCPGGINFSNPIWDRFATVIAQSVSLLKPREFVEIESGPLSPIPFLRGIATYACIPDNNLVERLRERREKEEGFKETSFVEMDVPQSYTFFNHPNTVFYTSRFIGCPDPSCEHCKFYASVPLDFALNALLSTLDILAPDSTLLFPFGTTKLISGEVERGTEVLWALPVKEDTFLLLIKKRGIRRLGSGYPTCNRNTGS